MNVKDEWNKNLLILYLMSLFQNTRPKKTVTFLIKSCLVVHQDPTWRSVESKSRRLEVALLAQPVSSSSSFWRGRTERPGAATIDDRSANRRRDTTVPINPVRLLRSKGDQKHLVSKRGQSVEGGDGDDG